VPAALAQERGCERKVVAYYKTALAATQWKATTEKPAVENGVESFMIFRNPANDLLRLYMYESQSNKTTRVTFTHQSAAEVEETDRLPGGHK
jgi:hypothetical protein